MTRWIERLLHLHRGDVSRGGLLFACLFLIISSYVVGKAARSALFLGQYAAVNLPYVTIAIALLVGLVVAAYVRVARRTSLQRLLVGSLLSFAFTALAFWFVARYGKTPWLYPAFYVWVGIFGVLAPAQIWTLANEALTTRQAKRLFGLVGSGAIAGFICGGYLTRQLVGRFGAESVLLAMAGLLLVCVALVVILFRQQAAALSEAGPEVAGLGPAASAAPAIGADHSLAQSLRLVRSSPYLRAIAAVICLSSFATTTANWQFEAYVQARFAMDKNEIGRFLGDFYLYAGMACLLVQLLATSRFLRTFGIGPALFVVPVALLGGSAAVLVFGTLWAAIVLRGSDQVLRYSIDKSTVELLYLPVASGIKLPVKAFIDTVVWRLGDGLSGVAVLVLATWGGLSARQVSWMNVVVLLAWGAAAVVARREYVETLRQSIKQHRVDAERGSAAALDRSTRDILADRLGVSDPKEILYALRVFEVGRSQATHPAVRGLLDHPSAEVREKAIAISNAAFDTGVRATVEQLLRDPHLGVRTEALLYLARHAHIDPLARIEELGDFADSSLRTAIVAYLAHPGPSENLEAAEVLLDQMVADTGADGARVRSEAARLMGRLTDPFPRQLLQLIADEDPAVASEAVRAVGQLRSLRFVLPLLGRIGEPGLTEVIAEALAGFGDTVVGALRDHLADPSVPAPIRREIPRILGRIGTRAAARVLGEVLLEADTTLRFRAIQALNKVYEARPDVERDPQMVETVLAAEILGHYRSYQIMGALRDALPEDEALSHAPRESMAQEVERIFRLLKLLYPRHDLHSACFGVQSEDPVVHDNALEFLDNILRPQLRAVLVPLLDSGVSVAERVRLARRLVGVPIDGPAQAAKALLQSDDAWLQSCGAYAVGVLGILELEGQLDRCLQHADPLLREAARQAKFRLAERSRAAARPPVL